MSWFTFWSFIRNRLSARRWDAFHSPYLFNLFSYTCDEKIRLEGFGSIEALRHQWLKTDTLIHRKDWGAGSSYTGKRSRERIGAIARHALSSPFQCRFMARLVNHENAGNLVELGTSLGISSCYLQAGNPEANITTIEGDPEIARIALTTFRELNLNEIVLLNSTFDAYLDATANETSKIDILFIDGHHESGALLHYFARIKARFASHTIVIVDDIYWSRDMQEGWKQLIRLPEVQQSVDCFLFGLLFFRNEFIAREHHVIRLPISTYFS